MEEKIKKRCGNDVFALRCSGKAAEVALGALAIVAVFSIPALAGLIELACCAVAAVGLSQVQSDQSRAIKLRPLASKDAGDTARDPRENLHGGGYCGKRACGTSFSSWLRRSLGI